MNGIRTIRGSGTPLSGWHFVCPCGWTTHGTGEPPTASVANHRAWHRAEAASIFTNSSRIRDRKDEQA